MGDHEWGDGAPRQATQGADGPSCSFGENGLCDPWCCTVPEAVRATPVANAIPRAVPPRVARMLQERFLFDAVQTAEIYAAIRDGVIAEARDFRPAT